MTSWPDVEAIVPTINWDRHLDRCLSSLTKQIYPGRLDITVVDGGSTDNTLDIARAHRANIRQFGTGIVDGAHGLRDLGIRASKAEIVWLVDGDNYIVEKTAACDMVRRLVEFERANIAIPLQLQIPGGARMNNCLVLMINYEIGLMEQRSRIEGTFPFLREVTFGISNASMIRRDALLNVGGWDQDERVLRRMRSLGIAGGVIVNTAHYYHDHTSSPLHFAHKWQRRVRTFAEMTDAQRGEYFISQPTDAGILGYRVDEVGLIRAMISESTKSCRNFLLTGNRLWLWGLFIPGTMLAVAIANPRSAVRLVRKIRML